MGVTNEIVTAKMGVTNGIVTQNVKAISVVCRG